MAEERDSLVTMRARHAGVETYFVVERAVHSVLFYAHVVSTWETIPAHKLKPTCPEDRCKMVSHGKCFELGLTGSARNFEALTTTNKHKQASVFVQSVHLRERPSDLDASCSVRRACDASQETKAVRVARAFSRSTTGRDLQLSRSHISARPQR